MLEARRRDELRQRLDGLAMEIGDAHRLVADDNAALAQAVLSPRSCNGRCDIVGLECSRPQT
jgi:hypothetical protein